MCSCLCLFPLLLGDRLLSKPWALIRNRGTTQTTLLSPVKANPDTLNSSACEPHAP